MTMPRKWIAVLAAAVAAGGLALAATSVLGGSPQPRPAYAQVDAKLDNAKPSFARALARKGTKPKAIYLTGQGTVDTSPPPQGTGPYIDFTLSARAASGSSTVGSRPTTSTSTSRAPTSPGAASTTS